MIKTFAVMMFAGAATLTFQSCEKYDDTTVTKTINVQLAVNAPYSLALETGDTDDLYAITTQASHQKVSELFGTAQSAPVYQYTPAQDFKGTDQVVVTMQENHKDHDGNTKTEIIYNINIQVGSALGR